MTDYRIALLETTRRSLFYLPVRNVIQTIQGGAMMGAFTQTVCLIDYIAYIRGLDESKRTKYNYKAFVNDYLKKVNTNYDSGQIYAVRCSLVHTFGKSEAIKEIGITSVKFSHAEPNSHLGGKENEIQLDLGELLSDTIRAIWVYFEELTASNDMQKIAEAASRGIYLIGVFEEGEQNLSEKYGKIHPLLEVLDNAPVDWGELKSRIKDLCLNIDKSKWYCKC